MFLEESGMKLAAQNCPNLATLPWQRSLCFLLALFLLYNPFQVAPRGDSKLDVCHPASYRATVATSELQHFTPSTGWDSPSTLGIAEFEAPLSQPEVTVRMAIGESYLLIPPQQFLGPGLWFRPPPAR